jgi:hypothetical protein
MTAPRDIDLSQWLDGTRHHPPLDESTKLAHEAARALVGQLGISLFQLVPAGRDKSLLFTALEEVLMRANRAIALHGGPDVITDDLRRVAGAQMPDQIPMEFLPDAELHEGPGVVAALVEAHNVGPHDSKSTWRSTVRTLDREIDVHIKAESSVKDAEYVLLGVLTNKDERLQQAIEDRDPDGFKGFWAMFAKPEDVTAFMAELTAASGHAWGAPAA